MDRTGARSRPRGRRALWVVLALVVSAVVAVSVLLPAYPADRTAEAALADPPAGVTVVADADAITLVPTGRPRSGLVFQPGARVDARAYGPILMPVAQSGHLVVIVRQPLGIGFLAIDKPRQVMGAHPEIEQWTLGGHSLGGVAAAQYLSTDPQGADKLLLWASYPAGSLADLTTLEVASIGGEQDPMVTPAQLEESRANLPPGASITIVPGAIHAHFGDYGTQAGDGNATVDRAQAQAAIVAASLALLEETA
ncbi:alpha/beta hydrolase [Propioniciclava sinopodophylli]|uniref:alpha/beta hydrolase n=1 Tax=Propioniciclava sinopodophylli TaxID=1837344 RepID=UPI0024909490|nr:alpha/beta hydrolase [Propioniciclava sinopodophylli]